MNSYYFAHDYNSANDSKILFLRQQLGMEGYGIFWFIVEQLAQAGGYLPTKIIPVLAMQMQVTEAKVRSVIKDYELFAIIEETFYSQRLIEHLILRKTLSESGKKGAKNRWLKAKSNEANSHPIDNPNSPPNAKERKESKESKEIDPLTFEKSLIDCIQIALKDEKWIRLNSTNQKDLEGFKEKLEKEGIYFKTPIDFKTHFSRWKAKQPQQPTKHLKL